MTNHKTIKLELRTEKPNNVYRYVYDWHPVQSSIDANVNYLLLHVQVQWGLNRDYPVDVFSIAMQYSTNAGENVDVSQPPHIPVEDIDRVVEEFSSFVNRNQREE